MKKMKTEKEINHDIINLNLTIQSKYPELSKYAGEMPITIPNMLHPEINAKILMDYYNSLALILKRYETNHLSNQIKTKL
jgi:hypothetical protein